VAVRTLGDLKTRIADELARADLSSQIALAISQAIEEACSNFFWFMQTRGVLVSLVAGTAGYAPAAFSQLVSVERVALLNGTQHQTLGVMTDEELDRSYDGSAPAGQPYAYAVYNDEIRFYPTPDKSYSVYVDGLSHGTTLAADTDSSMWTDAAKGERYIRALVKRQIYADVIRDTDKALVQDELAKRYKLELFEQTHSRIASNEMAAYA
jgi:hypothetical protein